MTQPDGLDEHQQITRWLELLRAGTDAERQDARTELGLILEQRGLLAEAADAYRANVEAGVEDRRPYERLAALARRMDDRATEALALRALADLLEPSEQVEADAPGADEPDAGEFVVHERDDQVEVLDADDPQPPPPEAETGPEPEPVPPPTESPSPVEYRPRRLVQARRSSAVSGWQAALTTVFVLVAFLIGVVSGRRLSDEAPPPIVNVAPLVSPAAQVSPIVVAASPAASAASPAPIGLRLSADASAPQPVARQAPSPSPAPTPLQTRCADAAQRFPETSDTEAAVRAAYREFLARQGVAVDAGTALFGGLGEAYAARHAEIVAGWMAVTLQRERRGLATFPLADYVASDIVVATGPGEYQMRATVSPQGWAEIRSWPADTCEGAFIRNPANARWVESMQASVGDISWALPTPAGR